MLTQRTIINPTREFALVAIQYFKIYMALSSSHLDTAVVQSTKDRVLICSKTQNKAVTEKTPSLQRFIQFYQKTEASALLLLLLIVYFRFSGPPYVFQKEHFGQ